MMQIVIDMPKKIFNEIQKSNFITVGETYAKKLINYIKKGTPLEQEPCNDMVSRGVFEQVMWERDIAIEQLKELGYELGEKPKTGWIPVSERLPDVGSEVLVCYEFKKKRYVYIADFYGDGEFHGYDDEYLTTEGRKYRKAVAWMPLPEPCKAESEVQK